MTATQCLLLRVAVRSGGDRYGYRYGQGGRYIVAR